MGPDKSHRRRGSIYVLVLGTALVVSVIGLSALMVTRIERRSAEGTADFAQARFYAQSAIEMGRLRIQNDPNWRTTYLNGVWEVDKAIGSGTYTLEGIDPSDGILNNGNSDPLVLTGTAVEEQSRYKLQVTLTAESQGLTCLEVALHTGTDLSFNKATVQCNQTISANNNVAATGSDIFSDVEAVNAISGGTYWQTKTTGITPRTMPDSTVFDYYITNGTAIDVNALPKAGRVKKIEAVVLSPASNPYGPTTNPEGIYVIDCAGLSITIRDCRIVGTLVLLDAGSASSIDWDINWEPAIGNYPALLVRGNMYFLQGSTGLAESSWSMSFNPPGTPYPYPDGVSDTDTVDSYPSLIKGLVYVSGSINVDDQSTVQGVLVVDTLYVTTSASLDLTYQPTFLDNPPPGFEAPPPKMVLSSGSWKQVVD